LCSGGGYRGRGSPRGFDSQQSLTQARLRGTHTTNERARSTHSRGRLDQSSALKT
jgi:hypothetical protein